jgi:hypothetical protein
MVKPHPADLESNPTIPSSNVTKGDQKPEFDGSRTGTTQIVKTFDG